GADHRRRRQGSRPGAHVARPQPRRTRGDQLGPPTRPGSGRIVTPRRGQRQPGRALPRRTAAPHRRGGARDRRRTDHGHRRDHQPRQARASRAGRRPHIATEVSEMNAALPTDQKTRNKATVRRFCDAANSGDGELISEGDKVASRKRLPAPTEAKYIGLQPTGRSVTYNEIFVFRFPGGRTNTSMTNGSATNQTEPPLPAMSLTACRGQRANG